MNPHYTLADASKLLAEYNQVKILFSGIDDTHCVEACNKLARQFNSAIANIQSLPIDNAKPASIEQVKEVAAMMHMTAIAEGYFKNN